MLVFRRDAFLGFTILHEIGMHQFSMSSSAVVSRKLRIVRSVSERRLSSFDFLEKGLNLGLEVYKD